MADAAAAGGAELVTAPDGPYANLTLSDLATVPNLRIAINYGDQCCKRAQPRNCATALAHGADACIAYRRAAIAPAFHAAHARILDTRRGAGLWLWKPYVIAHALCSVHPSATVLYMDAASDVTAPLAPVFALPHAWRQGVVPFIAPAREREAEYSRADVWRAMLPAYAGVSEEEVVDTPQMLAGFSVWSRAVELPPAAAAIDAQLIDASSPPDSLALTRTAYPRDALDWSLAWLAWSTVPGLLDDTPLNASGEPNAAGFREHTHDQSVFSVLAKATRLRAAMDPTGQYGGGHEDVWVNLHRDRS
ncbi:hypothetical protein H9P43_000491 [Blastocladiella emersonii ATCC 22665]|nr:hypothetical protein H9P43_000491 [Blastocladiella emersonii ATCC 22665]